MLSLYLTRSITCVECNTTFINLKTPFIIQDESELAYLSDINLTLIWSKFQLARWFGGQLVCGFYDKRRFAQHKNQHHYFPPSKFKMLSSTTMVINSKLLFVTHTCIIMQAYITNLFCLLFYVSFLISCVRMIINFEKKMSITNLSNSKWGMIDLWIALFVILSIDFMKIRLCK